MVTSHGSLAHIYIVLEVIYAGMKVDKYAMMNGFLYGLFSMHYSFSSGADHDFFTGVEGEGGGNYLTGSNEMREDISKRGPSST